MEKPHPPFAVGQNFWLDSDDVRMNFAIPESTVVFPEPVVTRGPMDFDNRPRAGCSGDAPCLKDSCPESRLPGQVAAFLVSRPRLQGGFAAKERGWSKFLVGKSGSPAKFRV